MFMLGHVATIGMYAGDDIYGSTLLEQLEKAHC